MEFVTFETAKKLKDKGFPQVEERALAMYDEDGEWYSLIKNLDNFEYSFEYFDDRDCVCPTISQVLKWLRDNCTTHLEMSVGRFGWYFATTNYEYHEEEKVYDIKYVKFVKEQVILKLEGIESIDEAKKLQNKTVFAKRNDLPKLSEGSFYIADIIGFSIITEDNKKGD